MVALPSFLSDKQKLQVTTAVNLKLHTKYSPSKQILFFENGLPTSNFRKQSIHSPIINHHLNIFFQAYHTGLSSLEMIGQHVLMLQGSPGVCPVKPDWLTALAQCRKWGWGGSLSKAQSHRSPSEALTPSRFLMDFRHHGQTHSWNPNRLISGLRFLSPPLTHAPTRTILSVLHICFLHDKQSLEKLNLMPFFLFWSMLKYCLQQ